MSSASHSACVDPAGFGQVNQVISIFNLGDVIAGVTGVAARVWREESGQDLIEYALVAALVGLGAVASIKTLGTKVASAFGTIGTTLTTSV